MHLSWCEEDFILISSERLLTEPSAELHAIILLYYSLSIVPISAMSTHVRVAQETNDCFHIYTCTRDLYIRFFCYFLIIPEAVPHFEKFLC